MTRTLCPRRTILACSLVLASSWVTSAWAINSDDFNRACGELANHWTVVDPIGDATVDAIGEGTSDAQLRIQVPAGTSHNLWTGSLDAPRVVQSVSDTDFELEVKFESALTQQYQGQGVIVEGGGQLMRFDFYSANSGTYIFAATFTNGKGTSKLNQSVSLGAVQYMRVARQGSTWTLSHSSDGTNFIVATQFTFSIAVDTVGVFALNAGGSAPAHTVLVDYFFDTFSPISPEDGTVAGGGTPRTLTVNTSGSGVVTQSPDLPTYDCEEDVLLTAVPAQGAIFNGWSGDVVSTQNPITVSMTADVTVTATFVPAPPPPVISNLSVSTTLTDATVTWTTDVPATSEVDYGPTAAYELGTESDTTLVTSHSITLPNLDPGTTYHYLARSSVGYDIEAESSDATFVTQVADVLISDDFNHACDVLSLEWEMIDPLEDATFNVVGGGTGDAQVEISVPAGIGHDVWTGGILAPRIRQSVDDLDFSLEAKFDSPVLSKYQGQGFVVETDDPGQFIRFDVYSNGPNTRVFAATFTSFTPTILLNATVTLTAPYYLRLSRNGDSWLCEYSADGSVWTTATSFFFTANVEYVGVFSLNEGSSPAHTTVIDYVSNVADPVVNEDVTPRGDASPKTVSVNVIGSGQVTLDPDLPTYPCGSSVTITAVEDFGYDFSVWSGDLSSTEPSITVVLGEDLNLDATFVVDTVPPTISNVETVAGQVGAIVNWDTDEIATSRVNYGETPSLEIGYVEDVALKTNHSIVLAGLNPSTTYYYEIETADENGFISTYVGALSTTPATPGPSGFVSDDFNVACAALLSHWSEVNPAGDCSFNVVGIGVDARLEIHTPAGPSHSLWPGNLDAPRVIQPIIDTDFEIEVGFVSQPSAKFQSQGIIVEDAFGQFIRFDLYHDGNSMRLFAAYVSASGDILHDIEIEEPSVSNMRVRRVGDSWTQEYSSDGGVTWQGASFTQVLSAAYAGVFALNHSVSTTTAPAFTAIFDYVFDTTRRLIPEDGNVSGTAGPKVLTTSVSGLGSVTADPDQPDYICGQSVAVTAQPDPGQAFDGWSGDVVSLSNPLNLTMSEDLSITANFILDTQPPVVSGVTESLGSTAATIRWTTNEPADSVVDYGETLSYEIGTVSDPAYVQTHAVTLTGLTPSTLYYYEITTTDANGFVSNAQGSFTTQTADGTPTLDLWYGNQQFFGTIGFPQPWVNIVGNTSDPDGVSSLTYSLNGGPERNLNMGPDTRRLADPGDFNIDIRTENLNIGSNTVIIRSTDGLGNVATELVDVVFDDSNVWPLPTTIDWSTSSFVPDHGQVVDGNWEIVNDKLHSIQLDYDRLVAIGDVSWTDYEVTVAITIDGYDVGGFDRPSNHPGIGLAARWPGHSDWGAHQPEIGYLPLGAIAWYTFYEDGIHRQRLEGNSGTKLQQNRSLSYGVPYVFKFRVETLPANEARFRFKLWEEGTTEPANWDFDLTEDSSVPQSGSILLISHHVEATFGNVTVVPLP
ncbi:MAG: hypothetical protein AAF488_09200 [Planctomycetota bacterium]